MVSKFIHKGFTLTELLIVIAIIGILSVIVFPYYHPAREQLALNRAASKLAQDLRTAQGMAMAAETVQECLSKDEYRYGAGIVVSIEDCDGKKADEPCKYRYILFADCNANNTYQRQPEPDIALDLIDFAFVEFFQAGSSTAAEQKISVVFVPPDPSVSIKRTPAAGGAGSTLDDASIVIRLRSDPTKTKTIKVNKAGLIYVE